jgi:hypothetical protein
MSSPDLARQLQPPDEILRGSGAMCEKVDAGFSQKHCENKGI